MTSEQLKLNLRRFLDDEIGPNLEREALAIANDLRNLVRDRVQTRGFGPDGRAFAPYVPSYARSRSRDGYQVRKVDYTRTGRLWASIIPEVESKDRTGITIAIGPRSADNRVKLLGKGTLSPRKDGTRRGLPTLPSETELRQAFEDWASGVINRFENTIR